ncbi:MAG: hypothetical protein ACOY3C_06490 [Bacillota bacterium]
MGMAVLTAMPGCRSVDVQQKESVALWVVAGTNRGEGFSRNSLAGYNLKGRRIQKISLSDFYIDSMFVDSRERLWLGQAWNDTKSDNKLLVWQDGKKVQEIAVGLRPEAGIVEFNGQIVAGCAEMGFGFSLWSVDMNTLASKEATAVPKGQKDFLLLTTIAASDNYLVAAAAHDGTGGTPHSSHTTIWWFDRDFNPLGDMYLGPGSAVWSILPLDKDRFLLLNNSAFESGAPDLLVFDPATGSITEEIRGAGYPYRGTERNGTIYILNRIWSSVHVNSQRSLTIIEGDEIRTIVLPDDFGAVDLCADENYVYLAAWSRGNNNSDGVYQLDPVSGTLTQIISHPDASRLALRHSR